MCKKCGCNTCESIRGPLLTEGRVKKLVSENLQYHINENIPLMESVFRIGSDAHLSIIKEARKLYSRGVLDLCEEDVGIIKTHLGEFDLYEDTIVPLDLPMLNEAEYRGKKVALNKPKRGGSKKFVVYTKNKKGNVVKVSFGGTTGLNVKIDEPGARASFAARHKCAQKKDKTKPGYWACNIGRYWKSLGGSKNFSGYW